MKVSSLNRLPKFNQNGQLKTGKRYFFEGVASGRLAEFYCVLFWNVTSKKCASWHVSEAEEPIQLMITTCASIVVNVSTQNLYKVE